MGTQKPVVIGGEMPEGIGGPVADHHGKKKEGKTKKDSIQEKIKAEKFKKEKTAKIEEKIEEKKPTKEEIVLKEKIKESEKEIEEKKPAKKEKVGKTRIRSKRYQQAAALIDKNKKYNILEAIDLVKKTTLSKFDGKTEVHLRILSKTGKPENLRGLIQYPHPTGKKLNIIILDEKEITEILKTGKSDFDIALAKPSLMAEVAKIAKILGPKGKMPNPKSGTVTDDPEKTKKELEGGKIEYKTDASGNIHQIIGKVSAEPKILEENFKALIEVLPAEKIRSLTICSTMGPGIKVLTK